MHPTDDFILRHLQYLFDHRIPAVEIRLLSNQPAEAISEKYTERTADAKCKYEHHKAVLKVATCFWDGSDEEGLELCKSPAGNMRKDSHS